MPAIYFAIASTALIVFSIADNLMVADQRTALPGSGP
jgi:hypothetical protein